MLPAETLGKRYVVTVPTGPRGTVVGHVVRLYGNVDGTKLTYAPRPKTFGAFPPPPDMLDAGQVAEIAVNQNFEVIGDQPSSSTARRTCSSRPMTTTPRTSTSSEEQRRC